MSLTRAIKRIVPSSLWNALRVVRGNLAILRFPARVVEHRLGSSRRKIWIADPLGEAWYDHDWPPRPELECLKNHGLRPGSRVFDLGAHQGVVALMMGEAVGRDGQVIAIEANPHNAAVAQKNRDLNAMSQITVRHAAVAEKRGTVRLNFNLNAAIDEGGGWSSHEVEGLSIDDLLREYGKPDVVYLDIEGYECRALSGASETLAGRPDCFIEVHVGHGLEEFGGSVDELLRYFPAGDYSLQMSSDAEPDFVPFDAASPMIRDRFYLLALSRRR